MCLPLVLEHYLEQIHAACIALHTLQYMSDTPEALLTALHGIADGIAVEVPDFSDEHSNSGDEHSNSGDEPYTEPRESEPWESKHYESWKSVLSNESVSQIGPYTPSIQKLFIIPFHQHDAFKIQNILSKQLFNDVKNIKQYVLPYAKDSEHDALKRVSIELHKVEEFLWRNTGQKSVIYDWREVTMNLKGAIVYAINTNSEIGFECNDKTTPKEVFHWLLNEAVFLDENQKNDIYTPTDPVQILQWPPFDLMYEQKMQNYPPWNF